MTTPCVKHVLGSLQGVAQELLRNCCTIYLSVFTLNNSNIQKFQNQIFNTVTAHKKHKYRRHTATRVSPDEIRAKVQALMRQDRTAQTTQRILCALDTPDYQTPALQIIVLNS